MSSLTRFSENLAGIFSHLKYVLLWIFAKKFTVKLPTDFQHSNLPNIFKLNYKYLFPIYLILFVVFFIIVLLVVVIIVVVIVDWPELFGRYITLDKRMLLLQYPRLGMVFVIVNLQI